MLTYYSESFLMAATTANSLALSVSRYPMPPALEWYTALVSTLVTSKTPLELGVGSPTTTTPGQLATMTRFTISKRGP